MTAKKKIIDILNTEGMVDNFYCIDNRITTRLGAYINKLRKQGWIFDGGFIEKSKNYRYIVVSKPNVQIRNQTTISECLLAGEKVQDKNIYGLRKNSFYTTTKRNQNTKRENSFQSQNRLFK